MNHETPARESVRESVRARGGERKKESAHTQSERERERERERIMV
jgi:hypothetical protein